MRLWHQKIIPYLPRQQLLGQHRECCALRGKGWTKKHATVQYALDDKLEKLVAYHWLVIDEMESRGYSVDNSWKYPDYRGKLLEFCPSFNFDLFEVYRKFNNQTMIYDYHDDRYLNECLDNLRGKGIEIKNALEK
jgi:uncharacterized protein (TIGR02328 family)